MGNHGPYSDRRPLALGSVGMTREIAPSQCINSRGESLKGSHLVESLRLSTLVAVVSAPLLACGSCLVSGFFL